MRIANLPWYDFPEIAASTDAFWQAIAARLRVRGVDDVPDALDRATPHEQQWRDPRLLLSQACGYDVLYDSRGHLRPIATPRFRAAGCDGSSYRSVVLVREEAGIASMHELRGAVCAVNERTSHSGVNAWRPLIAPLSVDGRFFREVRVSGAHDTSLEMLQRGEVDVACVDVVVTEICRRVRPRDLAGLRALAYTGLAPAPPWVTSRRTPIALVEALREALVETAADPRLAAVREALCLDGVELLDESAYEELQAFESPALASSYFELPAPESSPLSERSASPSRASRSPMNCQRRPGWKKLR